MSVSYRQLLEILLAHERIPAELIGLRRILERATLVEPARDTVNLREFLSSGAPEFRLQGPVLFDTGYDAYLIFDAPDKPPQKGLRAKRHVFCSYLCRFDDELWEMLRRLKREGQLSDADFTLYEELDGSYVLVYGAVWDCAPQDEGFGCERELVALYYIRDPSGRSEIVVSRDHDAAKRANICFPGTKPEGLSAGAAYLRDIASEVAHYTLAGLFEYSQQQGV